MDEKEARSRLVVAMNMECKAKELARRYNFSPYERQMFMKAAEIIRETVPAGLTTAPNRSCRRGR